MEFIDPRPRLVVGSERYSARLDPGREAPVVGLLANGFLDSAAFLGAVADALAGLLPGATFRSVVKAVPAQPLRDEQIWVLAHDCDAVVAAYGHCGSCTLATVRDGILFAKRGQPVVAIITERFWELSGFVANAEGMRDLPRVRIPYPVAGTGSASIQAIARDVAPAVLAALSSYPDHAIVARS